MYSAFPTLRQLSNSFMAKRTFAPFIIDPHWES